MLILLLLQIYIKFSIDGASAQFHLVDNSPLPVITALSAYLSIISRIYYWHTRYFSLVGFFGRIFANLINFRNCFFKDFSFCFVLLTTNAEQSVQTTGLNTPTLVGFVLGFGTAAIGYLAYTKLFPSDKIVSTKDENLQADVPKMDQNLQATVPTMGQNLQTEVTTLDPNLLGDTQNIDNLEQQIDNLSQGLSLAHQQISNTKAKLKDLNDTTKTEAFKNDVDITLIFDHLTQTEQRLEKIEKALQLEESQPSQPSESSEPSIFDFDSD